MHGHGSGTSRLSFARYAHHLQASLTRHIALIHERRFRDSFRPYPDRKYTVTLYVQLLSIVQRPMS